MKKTQSEQLRTRVEALNALRNLLPAGFSRVTIKIVARARDINGNTRLLCTYLCVYNGELYCIDGYIAAYYGMRTSRATKTHGSGIWVNEDPAFYIRNASLDLYQSSNAIKTLVMD